jgi:hypothetical protein
MAYELRDNSGSLWVNDRKRNAQDPDRTGTVMVDGKEYHANGWLKTTRNGTPYLSLSFKPKEPVETKPSSAFEEVAF